LHFFLNCTLNADYLLKSVLKLINKRVLLKVNQLKVMKQLPVTLVNNNCQRLKNSEFSKNLKTVN